MGYATSSSCGDDTDSGRFQIASRLGMRASTVHTVLVHCRINCLSHIEHVSGEPMRRYECDHSGSLIHVGVTKFVNTPDGSGWGYVGRQRGKSLIDALCSASEGPRI